MVSRKILDERGVFTCDMDDLYEQFDEIHSTVTVLAMHAGAEEEPELLFALQGIARSVMALRRDVSDIDEVLRNRELIVDAHDIMRRERERQGRDSAKQVHLWALEEEGASRAR